MQGECRILAKYTVVKHSIGRENGKRLFLGNITVPTYTVVMDSFGIENKKRLFIGTVPTYRVSHKKVTFRNSVFWVNSQKPFICRQHFCFTFYTSPLPLPLLPSCFKTFGQDKLRLN